MKPLVKTVVAVLINRDDNNCTKLYFVNVDIDLFLKEKDELSPFIDDLKFDRIFVENLDSDQHFLYNGYLDDYRFDETVAFNMILLCTGNDEWINNIENYVDQFKNILSYDGNVRCINVVSNNEEMVDY